MFESVAGYSSLAYRLAVLETRVGLVDDAGRQRPINVPLMPKDGPLRTRIGALIPKPFTMLRAFVQPAVYNPSLLLAGTVERSVLYVPYQAWKFALYDIWQDMFAKRDRRFSTFWTSFLGGAAAGVMASIGTHWMHISQQASVAAFQTPTRFLEAGYRLYEAESWYSFFDGIRARMIYNGVLEGLSFGFYTYFRNRRQHQQDGFVKNFLAGTSAGVCATILMFPFDYVNYRATYYWPPALDALSSEPVDEYAGTFDAWQKISAGKHGGYWGFAQRTLWRIARPAPLIGLQLALYEQTRDWCRGLSRPRGVAPELLPPEGPLETREMRNTEATMEALQGPAEPVEVVPYFSIVETPPPATTSATRASSSSDYSRSHLQGVFRLTDADEQSETN